jgi:hypothetical protein
VGDAVTSPTLHRAAHHEAAHAVIEHALGLEVVLAELREGGGGQVVFVQEPVDWPRTRAWILSIRAGYEADLPLGHSLPDERELWQLTKGVVREEEGVQWLLGLCRTAAALALELRPAIDAFAEELSAQQRIEGDALRTHLERLVGPRGCLSDRVELAHPEDRFAVAVTREAARIVRRSTVATTSRSDVSNSARGSHVPHDTHRREQ